MTDAVVFYLALAGLGLYFAAVGWRGGWRPWRRQPRKPRFLGVEEIAPGCTVVHCEIYDRAPTAEEVEEFLKGKPAEVRR